jgi:hypothetical protein
MTVFLISKGFKALESREQDWRRIGVLNFTWRMGVFYLGDTYEKIEIIFLTVSSAINFNIHSYQIIRFSLTITRKTLLLRCRAEQRSTGFTIEMHSQPRTISIQHPGASLSTPTFPSI